MITQVELDRNGVKGYGGVDLTRSKRRRVIRVPNRMTDGRLCLGMWGQYFIISDELHAWFVEAFGSQYRFTTELVFMPGEKIAQGSRGPGVYYVNFKRRSDALMFKLRWGGK